MIGKIPCQVHNSSLEETTRREEDDDDVIPPPANARTFGLALGLTLGAGSSNFG